MIINNRLKGDKLRKGDLLGKPRVSYEMIIKSKLNNRALATWHPENSKEFSVKDFQRKSLIQEDDLLIKGGLTC